MFFAPRCVLNDRLKMSRPYEFHIRAAILTAQDLEERFMWHGFSQALRQLWRVCLGGEGAYRPDLHYMRGPGPKWHAKYGSLVQKAVPTSTPTRAINGIAEHGA
jgi:hypothetical protein